MQRVKLVNYTMAGIRPRAGSLEESRKILRQLSHQSVSSDGSDNAVAEEVELLSNVYFDELEVAHSESGVVVLKFHITPSTADDKDKQFVSLDLAITLSHKYPNVRPEIRFSQSRGLSDAHLRGIAEGLGYKSTEYEGTPMIYELVEYAKECLTDNNRPCGQCAVCQFEFEETDVFTKTACYHYFHLPCLERYVEFFGREEEERRRSQEDMDQMLRKKPKQLECPVCREEIAADAACLEAIRDLSDSQSTYTLEFEPSGALRAWQAEMAVLLGKQRERGGVIDPTQQDSVIDETWVSTVPVKKESSEALTETDGSNHASGFNGGPQLRTLQRQREGDRKRGEGQGERGVGDRDTAGRERTVQEMAGNTESVRTERPKSGSKERTRYRYSKGRSDDHGIHDRIPRNAKQTALQLQEHTRKPPQSQLQSQPQPQSGSQPQSQLQSQSQPQSGSQPQPQPQPSPDDCDRSQQEAGKSEEGGRGGRRGRERGGGGRDVGRRRDRGGFRDGERWQGKTQWRENESCGPTRNHDYRGPHGQPRPGKQWEGDQKGEVEDQSRVKAGDQLRAGDAASWRECGEQLTSTRGHGSSRSGLQSPQDKKPRRQFSNSRGSKPPETRGQGRDRSDREDHSSGGQRTFRSSDPTTNHPGDPATYHSSKPRDRTRYHSRDERYHHSQSREGRGSHQERGKRSDRREESHSASWDGHPRDSTSRDSHPRDSTSQDSHPRDGPHSTSWDSHPRDSSSRDSHPRDGLPI